jgi:two-component system sensor histidine kinase KdpD
LDEADLAAALWAFSNQASAGRGADTLTGAKRLFLPMKTGRGIVGVVGLDSDGTGPILSPDAHRLLSALSDQSALSIERMLLMDDLESAKLAVETDRLRQALLTSISHDLKTPLAAIFGAAGTLRDLPGDLDDQSKAELLDSIIEESERLNRFIANLLDMTRLESGAVQPNASLQDVGDMVGAVLRRAGKILAAHHIEVEVAPGLPALSVDPVLLEQALFNILDNAAKYGTPGTTIRIEAWRVRHMVNIRILDDGPGIPAEDLERIFDKFYRARKGDSVRAGTGLGLAIARGFIVSMRGTLTADNRADGPGASFTISLPVPTGQMAQESAA